MSKKSPPSLVHRLAASLFRNRDRRGRIRLLSVIRERFGLRHIRVELANGVVMELDPEDQVQKEIICAGGYELQTLALFDSLLNDAEGFTDFGAHVGLYSLRAAQVLSTRGRRVFAIEPTLTNSRALSRNAELSGLRNIEICSAAFSDCMGIVRMVTPDEGNTGGSRLGTKENITRDSQTLPLHVALLPASALASVIPAACLDLVKLDVEGHELRILRSLLSATTIRPRNILLEYLPGVFGNPPVEETEADLIWLASEGYEILDIHGALSTPPRKLTESNLWLRRVA